MMRARAAPSPNTVWLAPRESGQARQCAAAAHRPATVSDLAPRTSAPASGPSAPSAEPLAFSSVVCTRALAVREDGHPRHPVQGPPAAARRARGSAGNDAADRVAAELGEPDLAVGAGRDADRVRPPAQLVLRDLPGQRDPHDPIDVRLGEP